MIALVMLGAAGSLVLGLLFRPDQVLAARSGEVEAILTVQAQRMSEPVAQPVAVTVARRVYPYSIIPGGVSGRDELLHVIKSDKVVAAHYMSFDAEKAFKVTVTKPRAVHVSYRKGDKVYWTAKKLMLVEGETLLSDGHTEMRARCANRISDVPLLPVEDVEPTEEELNSLVNTAMDAEELGSDGAQFAFGGLMFGAGRGLAGGETTSSRQMGRVASMVSTGANPTTPVGILPISTNSSVSVPGTVVIPAVVTPPQTEIENTGDPSLPPSSPEVRPSPPGSPTSPESETMPSDPRTPPDDAPPPESGPDEETPRPPPLTPEPSLLPIIIGQPVEEVHEVPEPNSLWLFGAAFGAMLLHRKRARRSAECP